MADKEPSVKSDANDSVSKIEKTLDTFMNNFLTRLEKLETRADDSFSEEDGTYKSDSAPQMLDDKLAQNLMSKLDGLSKRMDAFESKQPAEEKKAEPGDGVTVKVTEPGKEEAGQPEEKDKKPVPEEAKPAEMASDKSDGQEEGADSKVHHETALGALAKERGGNDLGVKDSARADSAAISALMARVAELENGKSDEDSAKYAAAQTYANRVYHAFGDANGAPRWAHGESLPAYIRRLVTPYKQHSKVWKDKDLKTMALDTLQAVVEQVYTDALAASKDVETVGVGQLRMIKEVDPDTNRLIRKFVGDPEACWGMFKQQPRILTGINVKS